MSPFLLLSLLVASTPTTPAAAGGGFQLTGRVVPLGEARPAGGGYVLSGEVAAGTAPRGGGFVVAPLPCGKASASAGCGCFCGGLIFSDGFEAGNTTAWASVVP